MERAPQQSVQEKLLGEMRFGVLAARRRLPEERAAAGVKAVRRVRLGDGLRSPEREGVTGVSGSAAKTQKKVSCGIIRKGTHMAEYLQKNAGADVLEEPRAITAEVRPVIFCEDNNDHGKIRDIS